MAADVEMTGVEPITADSDLPSPSVIQQWGRKVLFDYSPIQNILEDDEDRAIFWKARISGTVFLQCGEDRRFWMGECQLPVGTSVELEGLARRTKNMGKEKSQGNASYFGSEEPANTFTVQSPPAPSHAVLPTPSSVEQWTEKELLDCILVKEILADGEVWAKFKEAKIDGEAFLECGDDRHFWTGECHLPPGPSVKLAKLVQRIKNMAKEESRGNVFHLGSVEPANTCTHSILDCMRTMRVWRRVGPRVAPPQAGEDRTEDGDAGDGKAGNWKERRTHNRKRSRRWQRSIFLGS